MLQLRFPWLWWSLGWLMVAGVCVGSLIPVSAAASIFEVEDKLLHAGSYFLLMAWFGGMLERGKHIVLAAALILLGILLDMLQGTLFSRSFEAADIVADAVGVSLGFVLSRSLLASWCQRVEQRFAA